MRIVRAMFQCLAAAAGLLAAAQAIGEETMTFRPVPAESVSSAVAKPSANIHVRGTLNGQPVDVSIDKRSLGLHDRPPSGAIGTPEAPDTPEPPDVSDSDSVRGRRETTGDIVRFGTDVEVGPEQVVGGDVVSIGGNVRVRGRVRGSVTSIGGDVTLMSGSRVDDEVVCMGGTLREEPGSFAGGQRVTVPRGPGGRLFLPMLAAVGTGFQVLLHLLRLLLWAGLAFLVVKLAPGRTRAAIDSMRADPGNSFLVGLLILGLIIPSVIVLAIVIAILCITIIGIPLAAAVAIAYVAFLVLAFIWGVVAGYALLGEYLYGRLKGGPATLLAVTMWGLVAIHGLRIVGDLFHIVPIFGFFGGIFSFLSWAALAVLATLGAGALVRAEYQRRTVQTWWQKARPRKESREDDFPPPPAEDPTAPAPPPPPPAPPSPVVADPARYQPPAPPAEPPAPIA